MFKLNLKLLPDAEFKSLTPQELDGESVYGLLRIECGGKYYGSLLDGIPSDQDESQIIDRWLIALLQTVIELPKSNYCAIKDIDTVNTWLEIKTDTNNPENLLVSVIEVDEHLDNNFSVDEFASFKVSRWGNINVNRNEFVSEVINVSKKFLEDVYRINSKASGVFPFTEIEKHLERIG